MAQAFDSSSNGRTSTGPIQAAAHFSAPTSAPMLQVVTRVVFTVVFIVTSSGCVDRLDAGLSPRATRRTNPNRHGRPGHFPNLRPRAYVESARGHSGQIRGYRAVTLPA